jgi:hypothetical protein
MSEKDGPLLNEDEMLEAASAIPKPTQGGSQAQVRWQRRNRGKGYLLCLQSPCLNHILWVIPFPAGD